MGERNMLMDRYQRKINYLRISVTDKCNLRCRYCLPETGVDLKSHEHILRWEELHRMVKVFVEEGIDRVRITGGEPLVRKGLLHFIEKLSLLNLKEISITTNGQLLKPVAAQLKEAGITRVNISLDTLDAEKYTWITRGGDLKKVFEGIHAALETGLDPVKLNAVVVRGFNEDEVTDLARLTKDLPLHVRFIELMPVGTCTIWGKDSFVSTDETMERMKKIGLLAPAQVTGSGPAQVWQFEGFKGTVGFISAISKHICHRCNRIRLTADGRIYPCLHGENYVNCFDLLRDGESEEKLRRIVQQVISLKPDQHHLGSQERMMSALGG
nr:GTP 3',8-cyclase MoaA [Candidatus Formimonas warabiya]